MIMKAVLPAPGAFVPSFSTENLVDTGLSGAQIAERAEIFNAYTAALEQHGTPSIPGTPEKTGVKPVPEGSPDKPPIIQILYRLGSQAVEQVVVIGQKKDSEVQTLHRFWIASEGVMTEALQCARIHSRELGQDILVETPESQAGPRSRFASMADIQRLTATLEKTNWLELGQ